MTREQAAKLVPVLQAFAEGKTIQGLSQCGTWIDFGRPGDDLGFFSCSPDKWRIKPEPREWWIIFRAHCAITTECTKERADRWIGEADVKIIHVREVIP